jgi:hypothetical protein
MPHAPMHRKQRKKNLVLLAILLGLSALFFSITILKMAV